MRRIRSSMSTGRDEAAGAAAACWRGASSTGLRRPLGEREGEVERRQDGDPLARLTLPPSRILLISRSTSAPPRSSELSPPSGQPSRFRRGS